jgi:hypothetical protein
MTKKEYNKKMTAYGYNPDCRLYHHYEDMMTQKSARLCVIRDVEDLKNKVQHFSEDLLK